MVERTDTRHVTGDSGAASKPPPAMRTLDQVAGNGVPDGYRGADVAALLRHVHESVRPVSEFPDVQSEIPAGADCRGIHVIALAEGTYVVPDQPDQARNGHYGFQGSYDRDGILKDAEAVNGLSPDTRVAVLAAKKLAETVDGRATQIYLDAGTETEDELAAGTTGAAIAIGGIHSELGESLANLAGRAFLTTGGDVEVRHAQPHHTYVLAGVSRDRSGMVSGVVLRPVPPDRSELPRVREVSVPLDQLYQFVPEVQVVALSAAPKTR